MLLAAPFGAYVQQLLFLFPDVDRHTDNLYDIVAVAARYGHQQMSEIVDQLPEDLRRFNDAIIRLVKQENESSFRALNERQASGG